MLCSAVENRNITKVKINQLILEWQSFRKTFPLRKKTTKISSPKGHFITFISTSVNYTDDRSGQMSTFYKKGSYLQYTRNHLANDY